MMQMPPQYTETYRGHAIRISAATAASAPQRFSPHIEWVEQLTPQHVFYKLTSDDTSFSDPTAAVGHGVRMVRRWIDRMLATTPTSPA